MKPLLPVALSTIIARAWTWDPFIKKRVSLDTTRKIEEKTVFCRAPKAAKTKDICKESESNWLFQSYLRTSASRMTFFQRYWKQNQPLFAFSAV